MRARFWLWLVEESVLNDGGSHPNACWSAAVHAVRQLQTFGDVGQLPSSLSHCPLLWNQQNPSMSLILIPCGVPANPSAVEKLEVFSIVRDQNPIVLRRVEQHMLVSRAVVKPIAQRHRKMTGTPQGN